MKQPPTALITGGSSGIGYAIAEEMARAGYGILLVSNQEEQLRKCSEAIEKQFGVPCTFYFLDLTASDAAQRVYDYCKEKAFDIRILVNNAGILLFSETVMADTESIHAILQLHVYTPVMLCRLFGEDMKKKKMGFILNVSSISSVMPFPGISLYGPTKTFLRYFSRSLKTELKPHNVYVTCLIPGATVTALYDKQKVNLSLLIKSGIMHTPGYVAVRAVKALRRRKSVCIPGLLNKLIMVMVPLVPGWVIILIHRKTDWVKKG